MAHPARTAKHSVNAPRRRLGWQALFEPVDIASIVLFRILFGAVMVWEVSRYVSKGWIEDFYIRPDYYFTYFGFDWIRPWAGDGMYLHFAALGLLALFIAVGLWYRVATVLFFLGFTYVFLLDQTRYLNHFYLVSLVSFLMIMVPAHRAFSLDAFRHPEIRADVAPAWSLWILRAQLGLAYFFGGVAKMNSDWMLGGEPMRMWLARRTDFPVIGSFFTYEPVVWGFVYGGLLLDLLIVPLLLWPRTRVFAFVLAASFHLMNARLFTIGIFPWFMLGASLLFFPPDWPRRIVDRLRRRGRAASRGTSTGSTQRLAVSLPRQRLILGGLAAYVLVQVALPLRHHLYAGPVSWTEEGHYFAWHMKLRDKRGRVRFTATDKATGRRWQIDPSSELTRAQRSKMSGHPEMILQYSHHIARSLRARGIDAEVRAVAKASLNGRRAAELVDPTVDLAAQARSLRPATWIRPLEVPLHSPATSAAALDAQRRDR